MNIIDVLPLIPVGGHLLYISFTDCDLENEIMHFRLAPNPFGNTFSSFCSSRVRNALLRNISPYFSSPEGLTPHHQVDRETDDRPMSRMFIELTLGRQILFILFKQTSYQRCCYNYYNQKQNNYDTYKNQANIKSYTNPT